MIFPRWLRAELSLAGFFLFISCWYLIDAYRASARIENLLLILPAATVVILLCLWIIGSLLFHTLKKTEVYRAKCAEQPAEKKKVSVFGAMCILAVYILVMDWVGFDVATFLFMVALMFLQGERRIVWLGGFSLLFAVLVSLFFEYMIPYPMPMLLGREFLESFL